MCFTAPKPPKPGAQPPPPAAQGADSLVLGPSSQDDQELRNAGVMGRLALLVGRRNAVGTAPPGAAPGASIGVGGASGGGSVSSGSGLQVGGGSTGGGSGSGGGSIGSPGSSKA